jgi:hypothetical protein
MKNREEKKEAAMNTAYALGFMDKCAELGVTPETLVKVSQAPAVGGNNAAYMKILNAIDPALKLRFFKHTAPGFRSPVSAATDGLLSPTGMKLPLRFNTPSLSLDDRQGPTWSNEIIHKLR